MNESKKEIHVIPELCNGCRLCEMRCSFIQGNEFDPLLSNISIERNNYEGVDVPHINCDFTDCSCDKPECVEVCPTGSIFYCTESKARERKQELKEKQRLQPIFKVIAPWKWPYQSWKKWPYMDKRGESSE